MYKSAAKRRFVSAFVEKWKQFSCWLLFEPTDLSNLNNQHAAFQVDTVTSGLMDAVIVLSEV